MYGLEEKDKKNKQGRFIFDLEKRIKEEPKHGQSLLEKAELRLQEIKKHLREGSKEKDFDRLGILLHGYAALQKVLKKVAK
ncbi:MAG: DUF5398 family protein [Chlamydiia bacterium]|nr:DUF5398 family protein [Chlamydiia bacterium]